MARRYAPPVGWSRVGGWGGVVFGGGEGLLLGCSVQQRPQFLFHATHCLLSCIQDDVHILLYIASYHLT